MRAFVFLLLIFGMTDAFANEARVCFQGKRPIVGEELLSIYDTSSFRPPRCETMRRITTASQVVQITLGIGGVVMACTGAGLPATAIVESAVVGIEIFEFIVDRIPCDDLERNEDLQRQIKIAVCNELDRSGYLCRP